MLMASLIKVGAVRLLRNMYRRRSSVPLFCASGPLWGWGGGACQAKTRLKQARERAAAGPDKQEQMAADHGLTGAAGHTFAIWSKCITLGVSAQNFQILSISYENARVQAHTTCTGRSKYAQTR